MRNQAQFVIATLLSACGALPQPTTPHQTAKRSQVLAITGAPLLFVPQRIDARLDAPDAVHTGAGANASAEGEDAVVYELDPNFTGSLKATLSTTGALALSVLSSADGCLDALDTTLPLEAQPGDSYWLIVRGDRTSAFTLELTPTTADQAAATAAATGRRPSSQKPQPEVQCPTGDFSVPYCEFHIGHIIESLAPAPTATPTIVVASDYGGEGSTCAGMKSVSMDYDSDPWTKIWASPVERPIGRCECENTEVVLRVRASRVDRNLWCGYSCTPGYASCSRQTYCAGNCPSDTLCGFEALPNLTIYDVEKRVRGKWNTWMCLFDAKVFRDDVGEFGSQGKGAIVAAAAYDVRTGEQKPVQIGYRSRESDGHEPDDSRNCCGH